MNEDEIKEEIAASAEMKPANRRGFVLSLSSEFWVPLMNESQTDIDEEKAKAAGYVEKQFPSIRTDMRGLGWIPSEAIVRSDDENQL